MLAGLICLVGSWVTSRLFLRTLRTGGLQKSGWHVLAAIAAGVAIWCTHFIGMLGFRPGVPVGFDPFLTMISLIIAVAGSTLGFVLAGSNLSRFTPSLGGAIVGVGIALMHYAGMMAYRVQGIVSWDIPYLVASILFAVGFSAAALHFAVRDGRWAGNAMTGLLALAILTLHFTGITAFRVEPALVDGSFSNPAALHTLALAIAGMSLVIACTGLVSYLIDDDVRAESLEHLRRLALNDVLTGLPNRMNFNERLDLEIALAREQKGKLALIGIDLNRFKEINDLRGHHAGDEVLRALGQRMTGLLREGEFIARVGGDEFVAIRRLDDQDSLRDFLDRLRGALFRPVQLDDYHVTPGASFGVAIYPDDAATKEALINNADLAMYRAKADLMHSVCFYEPAMDEAARARRSLAADLRGALAGNQLSVHYQVQASLSTGEIRGFEALLRWNHPQRGFIAPAQFIPLAEEDGLILQIGEWVLREACIQAVSWERPHKVAVNLSSVQFAHTNLPAMVADVLRETGLAPERLELELTESTIFADRGRSLHTLRQIKALGVSIALDDFGTGYSSLDTLRAFPFDRIKLDQSFVSEAVSSPQDKAIIRAILALGKSLGIPVVAEGIETWDQLALLTEEGCDEAQGFLLGRPAPINFGAGSRQIMTGRSEQRQVRVTPP
ncbi:putative bifunctional diguanylate cyclase/phosphodiesterase [Paraburkholderia fungorum]